ncbi:putative acetyltransferase/hydrolase with alpha/beta hydrolase fold [Desulfosporosinus acidiphilus SJ4]|uniref:triacylglycerol lipase n=1 Tax=Desulfosporosinus acidiphilus (strain DSM 22704 / JCM 16185 / SJ4) TaxID=646529 RepID=I4D483_DESAJ|nr:lipase [Desulfosporosinus acidiphilus]AFM40607.1 putative acetyltransferase/hydrolase with alpha/beta hydrolase fold [Desulfosporosinus acidiphilus SJ4]
MKRLVSFLTLVILLLTLATPAFASERQNAYPIVLVVGFGGWDRSELLGFKYFGGVSDIQANLTKSGYQTFTAGVGPFSSNWDRACELYAMLKGGVVDYGAAHAAKYGHARFGADFGSGYYPQWSNTNKVHLVGHSMGGQTSRLLTQLLEQGSSEEQAYANSHPGTVLSPLFAGDSHWVKSVTTIATPNNGTSLAIGVTNLVPYAQQLIAFAAAAAGIANEPLYDFKLDQWGVKRESGESFSSYSNRVWNSQIWCNTHDISAWDLCPDGAKELNSWVKAQPDVYYFSWANDATWEELLTGYQLPDVTMLPLFQPYAIFMGSYTRNDPGHVVIDSRWWKNDGVVNTNSMAGPTLGSSDIIVNYNGTSQIGKWNYMGEKSGWDHADMIGIDTSDSLGFTNINDFYSEIANTLGSLK